MGREPHPHAGTDFSGQEVLVAGAGVTGRSAAAALVEMGASVTVTDSDSAKLAQLDSLPVALVPALEAPAKGTSLVVTSPGWRPDAGLFAAAARRGVEVIGDVELAWRIGAALDDPPVWLGVTGTNGKTTTVGMLEAMLRSAGLDAVACGNVGLPVLDAVRAGHDTLAVELSSFQLHWSSTLAPHASTVLNIAEDHLDWHGSLENYAAAKGRIHERSSIAVHNADDAYSGALVSRYAPPEAGRVAFTHGAPEAGELGVTGDVLCDRAFGPEATELATLDDLRLPGEHNVANALAAASLARARGVPSNAVASGLREFRAGAHRAVTVAELAGVRYVDDSKATNPHAATGALRAYPEVVWIAGGLLKGSSVDGLVAEVAGRLRGVVLLGADAGVIEDALLRHAPDVPRVRISSGEDGAMTAAVHAAGAMARPGNVVLLAPAAASMDMFRDYGQRGDAFVAAVRALVYADTHGVEDGAH